MSGRDAGSLNNKSGARGRDAKRNIGNSKKRFFSWIKENLVCFVILCIAVVVMFVVIGHIFLYFCDSGTLDSNGIAELMRHVGAALVSAILTIALILVASVQLEKNRESQRAAFLGGYVSNIFTNKEFADSFHYLIYTYDKKKFCRVKLKLEKNGITSKSSQEEMYRCLADMQGGREEGCRLYHPAIFQGSVEEKRLDSLLGYFNIIAYYWSKRGGSLLSIDDIDGSIGYQLAVIGERPVVRAYLKQIKDRWEEEGYAEKFGTLPPYHYLNKLLKKLRPGKGTEAPP